MKRTACFGAAAAFFGATVAHADGPYIGAFISGSEIRGLNTPDIERDMNSPFSGAFAGYSVTRNGWTFGPEIRVLRSVDANTRYDYRDPQTFPVPTFTRDAAFVREEFSPSIGVKAGPQFDSFHPYIGATIGVANVVNEFRLERSNGMVSIDELTDNRLTVSALAGFEYDLGKTFLRIEAEYRTIKFSYRPDWKQTNLTFAIGLRF